MYDLPSSTLEQVHARLRNATRPYKALMTDTGPIINQVLAALSEVEAIRRSDVNPHFLNRITCEMLHKTLREERTPEDAPEQAPLTSLPQDQQVTAFLVAMGYSLAEISDLLSWSPRKAKNLLTSAHKALGLETDQQLISQQLRFATDDSELKEGCPSNVQVCSCAHGDCEPDEAVETALHSVECGHCTELWLLAWAIEPTLSKGPLLARSITEDMRDASEPVTLSGPTVMQEQPTIESPASTESWMISVAILGALILMTLFVLAYWIF